MKTQSSRARLRQLRTELRYVQTCNRIDAKNLQLGIAKAKRIAAEMRILRKGTNANR